MEVHAHSHTARKKWTHYIWEFLMLFLAVFCGFLAENQREHFIEHQREKKYMGSLFEDLKQDTADLINDTTWWSNRIKQIDTIRMELEKDAKERNLLLLYKKTGAMRNYNSFLYHDRTIGQLKNAGNFRLIRKNAIADSLIEYDAIINTELKDQEIQSNAIYQELNFQQNKIVNSKYFHLATRQYNNKLDSLYRSDSEVFGLSASESELLQYYNDLEFYHRMTSYRIGAMKILCRKAINIIELLKKQYHLE
jgi:hypothetical protein